MNIVPFKSFVVSYTCSLEEQLASIKESLDELGFLSLSNFLKSKKVSQLDLRCNLSSQNVNCDFVFTIF